MSMPFKLLAFMAFVLAVEMARNDRDNFHRSPAMHDRHDARVWNTPFLCPSTPVTLDDHSRVNEDAVEIEDHRLAVESGDHPPRWSLQRLS